jgi:hypothetical protein
MALPLQGRERGEEGPGPPKTVRLSRTPCLPCRLSPLARRLGTILKQKGVGPADTPVYGVPWTKGVAKMAPVPRGEPSDKDKGQQGERTVGGSY